MNSNLEISNAVYTGVCIYNRLRNSIVEIDEEIVSLEDKRELGLYLGILHSQNKISYLLKQTELVKNTNIHYKRITGKEFCDVYDLYFKNFIDKINRETIEEYFDELLKCKIVVKLNREYNLEEFINNKNKQLIKK